MVKLLFGYLAIKNQKLTIINHIKKTPNHESTVQRF